MDTAQRDAVLRMLIPALGVVITYIGFFNKQAELTAAQASLQSAQAAAVSPDDLFPVRMRMSDLSDEQALLRQEKTAMDERWTRLAQLPTTNAGQRASALRQLTRMLWDRGLVPFEESPETASGQLPGSFDDVIKRISGSTAPSQSRIWRVRFYGRYRDVADTLASLGDLDVALVPVGLTMSEAHPDTDWRMWTLLLWN